MFTSNSAVLNDLTVGGRGVDKATRVRVLSQCLQTTKIEGPAISNATPTQVNFDAFFTCYSHAKELHSTSRSQMSGFIDSILEPRRFQGVVANSDISLPVGSRSF